VFRGPPTARIEPERQTVSQGTTAELRCLTSGEPSSVRWSKVGEADIGNNIQVSLRAACFFHNFSQIMYLL
jgi:hypothetical protein